jgi:L-iditol 2-dehydrogenase
VHDYRLEAARRFGADVALRADAELVERMLEANGGRRFDRVLVCTGALSALRQGLALADLGGTVLFFAPPEPDERLEIAVNDLWKRNVTLLHSYAGPPADMRAALSLIAAGDVDVTSMITHRLGLDETGRGFALVAGAGESLKVIVEPER